MDLCLEIVDRIVAIVRIERKKLGRTLFKHAQDINANAHASTAITVRGRLHLHHTLAVRGKPQASILPSSTDSRMASSRLS